MKNIETKIQQITENFKTQTGCESIHDYVENERYYDPGFMSWLFGDGEISDFGSNMTEAQETEYIDFLNKI